MPRAPRRSAVARWHASVGARRLQVGAVGTRQLRLGTHIEQVAIDVAAHRFGLVAVAANLERIAGRDRLICRDDQYHSAGGRDIALDLILAASVGAGQPFDNAWNEEAIRLQGQRAVPRIYNT